MPQPIGRRVLIELDKVEQKEGVILDKTEKIIPTTGVVRFLGTTVDTLKVGDRVFVGDNHPMSAKVKIEGEDFLNLPEEGLIKL